MSTHPPKSDGLIGKTIPFPVTPAKKSNDPATKEALEKKPIFGEKGQVLTLRRKRKRRTRPYAISVQSFSQLYDKHLREIKEQDK
jgi:hypothetical protein